MKSFVVDAFLYLIIVVPIALLSFRFIGHRFETPSIMGLILAGIVLGGFALNVAPPPIGLLLVGMVSMAGAYFVVAQRRRHLGVLAQRTTDPALGACNTRFWLYSAFASTNVMVALTIAVAVHVMPNWILVLMVPLALQASASIACEARTRIGKAE